jgi:hypothetical protein
MLGHRHAPISTGGTPVATGPSHSSAAAPTVSNWAATNSEFELARPTGVGRAITTYCIPIEGRDEWLAAARRLA